MKLIDLHNYLILRLKFGLFHLTRGNYLVLRKPQSHLKDGLIHEIYQFTDAAEAKYPTLHAHAATSDTNSKLHKTNCQNLQ